ncbi:MAG: glycosyl transferase family 1 [Epsilonproteobacteria bacterium]|nr:MAG: glycosyl transferase family 1 [Campylobacterota bacterium]
MKKLLYITDLDEYVDHSFIAPLFKNYVKQYLIVDIVYFTEFKSDFECCDGHKFTVPSRYKNILLDELNDNDVAVDTYDYIIVRNDITLMKYIVKEQHKYKYKTGYRFSFPKRIAQTKTDIANKQMNFLSAITTKLQTNNESKIINTCDIFLPTSQSMHKEFFPNVHTKTIVFPPGIDPNMLHPNIQHKSKETRFIYIGTLDKIREFETVLEAFSVLENNDWKLTISTRDPQYALELIDKYNNLKDNIQIHNISNRAELLDLIASADVGVALLPDIPIYNTSTPIKVLDYYSSTVPCLMTNAGHSTTLFTDCHDAWFCSFNKNDIKEKLAYIITLSKTAVAEVGIKGQARLLDVRNYEKIAKELSAKLATL